MYKWHQVHLRTLKSTLHFRLEGNTKSSSLKEMYYLFCREVIIELCVKDPWTGNRTGKGLETKGFFKWNLSSLGCFSSSCRNLALLYCFSFQCLKALRINFDYAEIRQQKVICYFVGTELGMFILKHVF